jgi:HD-GYP domain-containing protein (c-di-GMP phosphodiesterase class II)
MIRISKLFRKRQEEEAAVPKGIKPDTSGSGSSEEDVTPHFSAKNAHIKMTEALNKELEKESISSPGVEQLYADAVAKARRMYAEQLKGNINFVAELTPLMDKLVDTVLAGHDELLVSCLRDYQKIEDLFYNHIVNVAIISIAMGVSLGYDRAKLVELGIASFIHDIGVKDIEIINRPGALTDRDYDQLKRHPEEGAIILSKIDAGLNKRILDAVRQEHERADGSGYPKGLVYDEINEYALIIGLADVYEAMMHRRPYRARYTALETVRTILRNKKIFSCKVIKALIEAFGLFPVQALVQLNTKEIGIVVKRNFDHISRPIVDILIDPYGKELPKPKRINLAENPVIYIDNCVKQEA